jgi:hypothetical protein
MVRLRTKVAALLVLAAACLAGGEARAQLLIAAPGTSGDQLLFFYDATAGPDGTVFTDFLAGAEPWSDRCRRLRG